MAVLPFGCLISVDLYWQSRDLERRDGHDRHDMRLTAMSYSREALRATLRGPCAVEGCRFKATHGDNGVASLCWGHAGGLPRVPPPPHPAELPATHAAPHQVEG